MKIVIIFWLVPVALAAVALSGLWSPGRPTAPLEDSAKVLSRFYQEVEATHPSALNEDLRGVARQRNDCYGKSPLRRLEGVCQAAYLDGLMFVGRRRVRSAPELGVFLNSAALCPIAFSLCMGRSRDEETAQPAPGQTASATQLEPGPNPNQRLEDCLLTEIKCLEASFDRHWRGAPLPLGIPAEAVKRYEEAGYQTEP